MKISAEYKGSLYAILSGLLYGLVGYFGISLINSNLSISSMQFWRFLVSAIFMGLILLKDIKHLNEKPIEMLKAFLAGASFYGFSAGMYFMASEFIGTGLSMVVFFCFPAFVMIFNWFFYKTKISMLYYLAVVLIVLGMVQLVDLSELKMDLMGMGFAVLSALLYAAYIISSKNTKLSPMVSTSMVSLGCATSALLASIAHQTFTIPTTSHQWVHILGFGIISTSIPMLLLLKGLNNISSEKVSLLSVLEPVFVVIFGIILLGEPLSWQQAIGIVTILSGAIITLFSHHLNKYLIFPPILFNRK